MSALFISCSSCSFLETLRFVRCFYLLKSWVLLMSATNCCKIIAPRLRWVCTNFLTGFVEAIAAAGNEDGEDWWNCKYGGVSTNQRCQDGLFIVWKQSAGMVKSVHESVFSAHAEGWEGSALPEFISASLTCVEVFTSIQISSMKTT